MIQILPLFAQEQDAGLWMSVQVEKRLNRSLSASFSEEVRLRENLTEVGTIFSDIGLEYRFWNRFRIGGHIRFIEKRRLDDTYEASFRSYIDLSYREKLKPVQFILRLRFQTQYAPPFEIPDEPGAENYSRIKLTVKLDLNKRVEPYLYAESFIHLNSWEGMLFDAMRYCGGVEYAVTRMHRVDLFYLIQQEYQVKNPETDFIIGINYTFVF